MKAGRCRTGCPIDIPTQMLGTGGKHKRNEQKTQGNPGEQNKQGSRDDRTQVKHIGDRSRQSQGQETREQEKVEQEVHVKIKQEIKNSSCNNHK